MLRFGNRNISRMQTQCTITQHKTRYKMVAHHIGILNCNHSYIRLNLCLHHFCLTSCFRQSQFSIWIRATIPWVLNIERKWSRIPTKSALWPRFTHFRFKIELLLICWNHCHMPFYYHFIIKCNCVQLKNWETSTALSYRPNDLQNRTFGHLLESQLNHFKLLFPRNHFGQFATIFVFIFKIFGWPCVSVLRKSDLFKNIKNNRESNDKRVKKKTSNFRMITKSSRMMFVTHKSDDLIFWIQFDSYHESFACLLYTVNKSLLIHFNHI